jgi:hypothetical protein
MLCVGWTHVQAWQPDTCAHNRITQCSQVVQHSEVEGEVEFDLYLDPDAIRRYLGLEQFSSAHMECWWWTSGWSYQYAEVCPDGTVGEQPFSDHVVLDFHFDPPLSTEGNELILIGRVKMQVEGHGSLAFGGTIDGTEMNSSNGAQAGVVCDYEEWECEPCWHCYA